MVPAVGNLNEQVPVIRSSFFQASQVDIESLLSQLDLALRCFHVYIERSSIAEQIVRHISLEFITSLRGFHQTSTKGSVYALTADFLLKLDDVTASRWIIDLFLCEAFNEVCLFDFPRFSQLLTYATLVPDRRVNAKIVSYLQVLRQPIAYGYYDIRFDQIGYLNFVALGVSEKPFEEPICFSRLFAELADFKSVCLIRLFLLSCAVLPIPPKLSVSSNTVF